jgi:hypothetical protein
VAATCGVYMLRAKDLSLSEDPSESSLEINNWLGKVIFIFDVRFVFPLFFLVRIDPSFFTCTQYSYGGSEAAFPYKRASNYRCPLDPHPIVDDNFMLTPSHQGNTSILLIATCQSSHKTKIGATDLSLPVTYLTAARSRRTPPLRIRSPTDLRRLLPLLLHALQLF